ncbi:hypothetical protein N9C19_01005 [bacterium]|nr:hypothetical protein [bacterium]
MSKNIIWFALRLTFFIVTGILYALVASINPAPVFNILLLLGLAALIWLSAKEIKMKQQQFVFVCIISIILSYIILGIKSTFFIAHFNEMYLGEASSLFPNNWMINSSKAVIFPSIWFEKVMFAFSYEVQTFKIGSVEMSLGLFGTKILKISELMLLCFISFIASKKVINI